MESPDKTCILTKTPFSVQPANPMGKPQLPGEGMHDFIIICSGVSFSRGASTQALDAKQNCSVPPSLQLRLGDVGDRDGADDMLFPQRLRRCGR